MIRTLHKHSRFVVCSFGFVSWQEWYNAGQYEYVLNFRNHLKILLHLWISCAFVLYTFTQYGSIAVWNRYTYFFRKQYTNDCWCRISKLLLQFVWCVPFSFLFFSNLMVEPAHFFMTTHHELNPQLVTVMIIVLYFVWKMIR